MTNNEKFYKKASNKKGICFELEIKDTNLFLILDNSIRGKKIKRKKKK
jgi:hypothetical protein